jgi:shikimate kinase
VKRNRERPMLHTADPRQTFQELLDARRPLYQKLADITLDTRGLTPDEAAYGLSESVRVFFAPG